MSRRFYKTSEHFFHEKQQNFRTIFKHFLTQGHHTFAGFLALNVFFQSIIIESFCFYYSFVITCITWDLNDDSALHISILLPITVFD